MNKWLEIVLNILSPLIAKKTAETPEPDPEFKDLDIEAPKIDEPYIEEVRKEIENPEGKLIDLSQLIYIMPNADELNLDFYLDSLNYILPHYKIDTPIRIAHFIAQLGHESGDFRYKKENLNYSANALRSVFGKYFKTDEMANQYARKPREIANIVYANRMGNGDTQSDEGWKYRGRGLIQLTGKDNYRAAGKALHLDLVKNPDLVNSDPDVCIKVACWYWDTNRINRFADKDDTVKVTKAINGGDNGLKHREELTERAKHIFNV